MSLIDFLTSAGAKTEESTDRDGGFSYHAESHAAGIAIGIGYGAVATGSFRLIGALLTLAVYGRRGSSFLSPALADDIRQEPHYALGGLVVGALLGLATRVVVGDVSLP